MEQRTIRAMRLASEKARHRAHRHAALVYRGGALISQGTNHDEVHAEVAALRRLWPSHREDTTVVSIRMTKGNKLGMAKPCPNCEEYMRLAGVKKVVYSDAMGQMITMRL
jgi:pyrimidine deaminase RibD-like protein